MWIRITDDLVIDDEEIRSIREIAYPYKSSIECVIHYKNIAEHHHVVTMSLDELLDKIKKARVLAIPGVISEFDFNPIIDKEDS